MDDAPQSLITEYRESYKWSKKQLADNLECSQSQVFKHENGDAPMTIPWLRRYANAFNIRVSDLLTTEDKTENLTPAQTALMNNYNLLTSNQQEGVLALVSMMAKDNQ